jgi:hypothetical protein
MSNPSNKLGIFRKPVTWYIRAKDIVRGSGITHTSTGKDLLGAYGEMEAWIKFFNHIGRKRSGVEIGEFCHVLHSQKAQFSPLAA